MDAMEEKFRKNLANPKKHVKSLTEYIEYLLEHEHILEASYYLNELLKLKPKHEKALTLGYKLAIRRFDIEQVIYFDKQLKTIKAKNELLLLLELEYFCSINNHKKMEACIEFLLIIDPISQNSFQLMIESALILKSYNLCEGILRKLKSQKLQLNEHASKKFKEIAIIELVERLSRVHK